MKKIITLLLALFILLGSAACSKKYGGSLVIYTPNGEALRGVVDAFEEKYGIDVELISLDESDCFKRITKEADKPLADVLYGGLSYENSIKYKEFFEEYTANGDNNLPAEYQNTTGVTTNYCIQAASVILINTNAYEKLGLDASEFDSYQDLLQSELKGNIMFANPEKTAIGYRSLINMLAAMGSDPYDESAWSWVSKFTDQLIDTVNKETTIYTAIATGQKAVGIISEKLAVDLLAGGAEAIKIVYPKEGTVWATDGAAIIKNAQNMENAKLFVDWLISKNGQKEIAKTSVRPVNTSIENQTVGLVKYSSITALTPNLDAAVNNKKDWQKRFKNLMFN